MTDHKEELTKRLNNFGESAEYLSKQVWLSADELTAPVTEKQVRVILNKINHIWPSLEFERLALLHCLAAAITDIEGSKND